MTLLLLGISTLAALFVVPTREKARAVTFSSDLLPLSSNQHIGVVGSAWRSLNAPLLYFSGLKVGINTSIPQETLHVNGGFMLTTVSAPVGTCTNLRRGTWYVVQGVAATDTVQVCLKKGDDSFGWVRLLSE